MPRGALLPVLLLLGYSVHLDTLTLVNWWTSLQEVMFTEGAPNIHVCWSFPLGFTVSQKKNPLIFYLANMRDFKLPAFREEGQEREKSYLSEGRYHLGSLCFKYGRYCHLQLCLVPHVKSQINPINQNHEVK